VIPIGDYVLDVDVHELSGVLSPGRPVLGFGGDRASMLLPVKVREGRGEATFHFVWKSNSLPDLTCGDWNITQKVSGTVVPTEYLLSGGMSVRTRGNRIVCTPEFPETKLRLRVTPSPESRDALRSLLAQKQGLCGWVIERVDLPGLLSAMLEAQGFDVAIPMNQIPALDLPAGVRESVRVGGRVLVVEAHEDARLDAEAIWYSADVLMRPAEVAHHGREHDHRARCTAARRRRQGHDVRPPGGSVRRGPPGLLLTRGSSRSRSRRRHPAHSRSSTRGAGCPSRPTRRADPESQQAAADRAQIHDEAPGRT
jgi:hypothetical protein